MKNRYYFLDNLRWATVLLVLFYHVFYNYNSLGVFGAIGGFADHQWQDIFCTFLNPWFMTLLFVVAGASSRYALQRRTPREFRRERTLKLLVPSTIGLMVFGWVLGWLNMTIANAPIPEDVPLFVKWLIAVASGTGPLWFIQDLFGFSLLLLLVRRVVDADKVDRWLTNLPQWGVGLVMVGFFGLLWLASQSQIDNPTAAQGLINLYRPVFYFVGFLCGYYIFSSERIHTYLAERAEVLQLANIFHAKVMDVDKEALTIYVFGSPDKLKALIRMLEDFGIMEIAKTGTIAIERGSNTIYDNNKLREEYNYGKNVL